MKSVFEYTVNKKAEDTTSGILEYLLDTKKESSTGATLRSFFTLPDQQYNCNGQEIIADGRFDLVLESFSADYLIVIENKLGARFTWNKDGEHQLKRYSTWLSGKVKDHGIRRLIVLCPKKREWEVREEIDSLGLNNSHTTELLRWEDLCEMLKNDEDAIAKELANFIDARYISGIELSAKEIAMINTREAGSGFLKIYQLINQIHDDFDASDIIKKNHFDTEDYSFGFYFRKSGVEYYLGTWPEIWACTGSPLVLQKRTTTNKNVKFRKIGDSYGFIYSFESFQDLEKISTELHEVLTDR